MNDAQRSGQAGDAELGSPQPDRVERLEQCRRRLDDLDDATLDVRADGLEFVHGALIAELDDLLDRDRRA